LIHLYYHGGSANHGCEAIVRSTGKILEKPMTLWSSAPEEDRRYGVDRIVALRDDERTPPKRGSLTYYRCALEHKLVGGDYSFTKVQHRTLLNGVQPGDICLSIGGDNYCYSGVENLGYYNRMLKSRGAKTVLWGCSVDPDVLTKPVVEDLRRYDLITVRESLSYEGLQKAGLGDRAVLCADPAFQLDMTPAPLPEGFTKENTIGVNVSPLAASCGAMVMENYLELVRYILRETTDSILLIPHVVKSGTDDRQTLRQIAEQFPTDRVRLAEDTDCMRLKSLISQCKRFVGARTHATIAAYSTCVPTLVAGYSIKARGIARDLFGTEEHYVVPVQGMTSAGDLTDAYRWIADHSREIGRLLEEKMPAYKERAYVGKEYVERLG
jgi:polysaccharide pyruvyl transferase WcaK-like protein